ncbi:MAG: hypothetical protein R2686_07210, partial [Candidatus Nanopelagicales bacterium]
DPLLPDGSPGWLSVVKTYGGGWPQYLAPLVADQWYYVGLQAAHAHFSYSSYDRFRDQVSIAGIGAPLRDVLAEPARYADRPLTTLVDFSDIEGILGPAACQRIYDGLVEVRDALKDEWEIDNLIACFDAGRTGLVEFG